MKWHLEQGEANGGSSAKSFTWTTVQLNYNTECDCHVDANNMGSSKIIGLGNYSGGELWVAGQGQVDINGRFYTFDGRKAHATMPFRGTRFTLVYYVDSRFIRFDTSLQIRSNMEAQHPHGYEFSSLPTMTKAQYNQLPESQKPFMPNSKKAKEIVEAGKSEFETLLKGTGQSRSDPQNCQLPPPTKKKQSLLSFQPTDKKNGSVLHLLDDDSDGNDKAVPQAVPTAFCTPVSGPAPWLAPAAPPVIITDSRPSCMYGAACYRKSRDHFRQFSHPPGVDPYRKGLPVVLSTE